MANGLTLRRNVEALQRITGALDPVRDAYAKMQALTGTDNRSWIHWAGLHGFPQFMCWHHGRVGMGQQRPYDLFLPWHRAYLLYFEHTAKDQNAQASIPWWDWSSALSRRVGLPKSFTGARAGANRNPLRDGPVPPIPPAPARSTVRFPGRPANLPSPARVNAVLALNQYVDFSNQLQDIHDSIHGWAGGRNPARPTQGGDMGAVATSAFDPIFWSHHCMIDRLWYLWQLRHGESNIPPDYLDKPLAPFALNVKDVLNINTLGYEYAGAST
ncbi:MAG: tyrosinase family protein [Bryobacteraceae bacterium]